MYTTIKIFLKILLLKAVNASYLFYLMQNIVDFMTHFSVVEFIFVSILVFSSMCVKADVFYFANHDYNGAGVSVGSGQVASAVVSFRFVVPDMQVITVDNSILQKPSAIVQIISPGQPSSHRLKKNKADTVQDFILTGQTFSTNKDAKFGVSSGDYLKSANQIKLVNQSNNDFVEIPIRSYSDPSDNKGISRFKVIGKINSSNFKGKSGDYIANMTLAVNLL